MTTRKQREIEFHNKRFKAETRNNTQKYYVVDSKDQLFYQSLLTKYCKNRKVLEYGCGKGSLTGYLLRCQALTTGIDISDVAIDVAQETFKRQVMEKKVTFRVMDAENLQFDSDSFDVVCGKSILHHLDLDKCYAQIGKVLKPDGKAIFLEPLGHNPVINWYRRHTPHLRTKDEHPLLMRDLLLAREYFNDTEFYFFRLFSLLAVPFRNTAFVKPLLNALNRFDELVIDSFPFMKKYSWIVIMVLSNPKRGSE